MHRDYSGQLLDRTLLRLLPDVFFHAVWIHFVEAEAPLLPRQIQSLLDASAELLSAGNSVEACQTLFMCAFQQFHAGDDSSASNNMQRILVLAEQHGLLQVACWATWGAAAVCVRRGWFQQAAEHLEHLQFLLGQQQDWVLSDVIDIIRRALLSQAEAELTAEQPQASDAILSSAFDQMLHWGMPRAKRDIAFADEIGEHTDRSMQSPTRSASFNSRSLWQVIKRVIKGELRLKWVDSNGSALQLHGEEHSTLIARSPFTLQMPPVLPSVLQPDQKPEPDQSLTLRHAQLSAPYELPAPEQPTEPYRLDQPAAIDQPLASDQPGSAELAAPPSIMGYLMGTFSFVVNAATVMSWPTGKGRAVFKYMLAHHNQPIPRDMLMDTFWPQAEPESARNSLNVALHGLRQALKTVTDMPVILFEEGAYCISSEFHVWVDVDEFDRHVQAGRRLDANGQVTKAAAEYEAAIELYRGDFLSGDLYEEWPTLTRERLRVAYLEVLDHLSQIYFDQSQYADCITLCQRTLVQDACREDVHCLLMRCYSRQGLRHLALRQYQTCVEALRAELDVDPVPTTTQVYEKIRRRERV
jgi:DNA-binding SARP family transcriptional activator